MYMKRSAFRTLNQERSTYRSRDMATDMQQVALSPADIPGADLSEPFDRHTMPELRWWLLCRGIKVPVSSYAVPQ